MLGIAGGDQAFKATLDHRRIAQAPRSPKNQLHILVKMIRKMAEDVALLVDLTALDSASGPNIFRIAELSPFALSTTKRRARS